MNKFYKQLRLLVFIIIVPVNNMYCMEITKKEQKKIDHKKNEKQKELKKKYDKAQKLEQEKEEEFNRMLQENNWEGILKLCNHKKFAHLALFNARDGETITKVIKRSKDLSYQNFPAAVAIEYNIKTADKERVNSIVTILDRCLEPGKLNLATHALLIAIRYGDGEIFDHIIEWHIRSTQNNTEPLYGMVIHEQLGLTPVMIASMWGDADIIDKIFFAAQRKSEFAKKDYVNLILNARDARGNTPLMIAISGFSLEPVMGTKAIYDLLKKNPDITATNNKGDSVFTLALNIEDKEEKQKLLQKMGLQLKLLAADEIKVLKNAIKMRYEQETLPDELLPLFHDEVKSKTEAIYPNTSA